MTPEQHLDDIEMIMGGRNGPSIQLRAQISDLQKQLAAAKEDADYAWRNTRTVEAARQDEMRKRDAAEAEAETRRKVRKIKEAA